MKNVDDLIESANELAGQGLSNGEIADELNVSRETASWLVERGEGTATTAREPTDALDDIHVDWSALGRDSTRLADVGHAMADLLGGEDDIDLVVGIEKAGTPLATTVALELGADLAAYAPRKHQWEEGDIEDLSGSFSRNFAEIRDRDCYVIDDTITSGTTMTETIDAITEQGGTPVGCGVLVDKQGVEELEGVPVESLLQVIRVSREE
ncbi:transcriptional regulator GfcR [Halococcus sediminicola]|uniref:transcriptional regulator GfcR n=1 Tax=Halococcus sediminicola TaxID=1264579 RepID=UPI00067883AE|nr:transcriptional regulator GfcR [Halococcus sediminicola]